MLPFPPSSPDLDIDPHLGYPPAFAKLSSHLRIFPLGSPPIPRPLSPEQAAACEELGALFPVVCSTRNEDDESGNDSSKEANIRKYESFLWSQLDHLGKAGFDPSRFRVDPYGNVLQWDAPRSSPLAWDLDHWFPRSRGGRTVAANLRLIQWQVSLLKGQKLEFLMPWWDFQLGVSVAQFLHIYASSNADFRRRGFFFLFQEVDGDLHCRRHAWPLRFKEEAAQHGLAAAAIVKVKIDDDGARSSDSLPQLFEEEEEDTLTSTEHSETEMGLAEPDSDGYGSCETKRRAACENLRTEVQQRKAQICVMKKELRMLKRNNEMERVALQELENNLVKHKKQLEKQWHWSETYRQCFERIIRDVVHQSFMFREQARLNQAACNTLLSKIRTHKMNRAKAEADLVRFSKHRQPLGAVDQSDIDSECTSSPSEILERLVDPKRIDDKVVQMDDAHADQRKIQGKCLLDVPLQQQESRRGPEPTEALQKQTLQAILEEEVVYETTEELESDSSSERSSHDGIPSQNRECIQNDMKDPVKAPCKMRDDLRHDAPRQEVSTVDGNPSRDVLGGEFDFKAEEQQLGKMNVDNWLQRLLQNTAPEPVLQDVDTADGEKLVSHAEQQESTTKLQGHRNEKSKKMIDGLFRLRGFRYDARKSRTSRDRDRDAQEDARSTGSSESHAEPCKSAENDITEVHCITLDHENSVESECGEDGEDSDCVSDMDFVRKMREIREEEKEKKHMAKHQSSSMERQIHHQCQEENPDENATNGSSEASGVPFEVKPLCPDKMHRSYSMRVGGERWDTHGRRASVFSPILEEDDDYMMEEMGDLLQPSWSMRDEGDADHGGQHHKSTRGFKASWKTCTKAWKRAVSKRRSNMENTEEPKKNDR